jgi:hypothetical protein
MKAPKTFLFDLTILYGSILPPTSLYPNFLGNGGKIEPYPIINHAYMYVLAKIAAPVL